MESELGRVVDALPGLVWTALPDGQIDFLNQRWCGYTGLGLDESRGRGWQAAVHPDDLPRLLDGWQAGPAPCAPVETEVRLRGPDGIYRWFLFRSRPSPDASGRVVKWCVLGTDMHDRRRAREALREDQQRSQALLAGEKRLLEMIASGRPMQEILEALCRFVENTVSGCSCSIMLLDPSGTKLQEAIAPSIPADFNDSARGWPLDRIGGPCVMAARDNIQVIMSDVASDTRWRNGWRALAQAHGLRSCWSTPIVSQAGKVLGTFALYQREPGSPSPLQLELIEQFTHIASIAIERAQRDAALRQSEARLVAAERDLQSMIDTIPVFIAAYEPDGTRSFVNRTWQDYMGLTREEATGPGAKIFPHFHPDDAEMNDRVWRASRASGEPLSIEVRVRRADGQYRWHTSQRVSLRDDKRNVVRWYSVGVDIHDQKVAEDALRRSEARLVETERELQLTLDTLPALVASYRPDGSRIFVNRTWLDYTGLSVERAIDTERASLAPPEDAQRIEQEWRKALAAGVPFEGEMRLRRGDGEYRWHAVRRVPARDESGAIARWYSVGVDIEERKRAEEALRESEYKSRLMVDSIPGLLAIFTPDGEFEFVNRQIVEYFGRTLDDLKLKRWRSRDAIHPEDFPRGAELFKRSIASGDPFEFEVRCRRFDGVYRWFQSRGSPLRDTNGRIVRWYNLLIDIDERKRAEEALRQSEARLSDAERELRVTLDSIPVMTWRGAANGYVQQLNKRWFEYTGTTPEEVRGRRWKTCVHPDDLEEHVAIGTRYVAAGTPIDSEARLRRFDGTYRWFLFRPAPARDETGKIVGWYGSIIDIEDRKRAEQKAAEAERELQRTIDHIPVLVGTYGADGARLSANKRALEVTGLSPEDLPDERWRQVFHPDEVEPIEAQWRACVANGEPFAREVRTRMADGTYRWHWTRRVPLRDEAGKVVRWYGVSYDIEDRKRAETQLAGEKQVLEMIASGRSLRDVLGALCKLVEEAAADCYCDVHPIDWSGPKFLYGVAPSLPASYTAPIAGLPVRGDLLPCGVAALENVQVIAVDIESDPRWYASPVRTHALEHGVRSVWSTPISSTEGRILGTFCIYQRKPAAPSPYHQDLIAHAAHIASIAIERLQAEAALRRSEAFLAKAQRLSLTGSFSFNSATEEATWSEEVYRIYEFQPGARVTLSMIESRYHPEDRHLFEEQVASIRSGATDLDYEHRLLMPDGSIKHVHMVAHGGRGEGGGPMEYFGAVQDVTQRRLADVALDKARSELAHVTRVMSLSALTASIAHEVNQPLAGIITNAGTCLRMLGADPPNIDGARETARRTIRDGNRAADVITRLRALFSKRAAAAETVDLNEATREVLALVFSDLLRNKVFLRAELDDDHPLLVTGDRVQLQQVILNLVRNASDAMSDVNDRPRHLLVKAERDEEGSARLIVRDSGVGLDPQSAERLFDAFYTTKSDGMGIGLSVSRSIVESHGGKLWAEANDGPGTTFSFSIPLLAESATGDRTGDAVQTPQLRDARDVMRNS